MAQTSAAGPGQTGQPTFHGPNAGYVLELYERYQADPSSVDPESQAFFATWTPPTLNGAATAATPAGTSVDASRILAAAQYAQALRAYGHQAAQVAPVGDVRPAPRELAGETWGVSDADLDSLPASIVGGPLADGASNAREAIERLRDVYSGTIGYEFDHVQDVEERHWLRDAAESGRFFEPLSADQKRQLLERLTEVEGFERFLHTTYLGVKRFSIEGTDTLVPILDEIAANSAHSGVREIALGMAHRGRLNVLAHVLGKPYEAIFQEFEHGPRSGVSATDTSDIGWTGDVKYHLGLRRAAGPGYGRELDVPLVMAPNPSHLEFVNPVVEGMARASQEHRDGPGAPTQDLGASLAILIHGDAAFPGQGTVSETLNLAQLRGYTIGGTIHIIANNQIGYTTDPLDSRSTLYASDLAKGFEIPIVHVNADDPVACLAVARMAATYRQQFKRDFLIDLIGYRRWGHNEGDEPTFTQPRLYAEITARPTVRALWAQELEADGTIGAGEGDAIFNAALDRLATIRAAALSDDNHAHPETNGHATGPLPKIPRERESAVPEDRLRLYNDALHTFPEGFTLNGKLERQLQRRRGALDREGGIDWAHAESLAYASILHDGTPIRLTGQDAERGTFSQRHLVLHDPQTGDRFTALQALPVEKAASFAVYNSPLSEQACLGFEYGYGVYAPDTLVLWEAQFGDFANGAQVIIDQFIAAAAAKWRQPSSIVLLLPHGYEGQGPEHSSARLERFLQLAAGRNLRVANCTSAGQYFHLLRRQAMSLSTDPRPLVVMTPKSLLRHPKAGSSLHELANGGFQPVIDDPQARDRADAVSRVVFCSGKVAIDLFSHEEYGNNPAVAIVRVEELHPFPEEAIQQILGNYRNAREIVWLQEEPKNMGAWSYVAPRLRELAGETLPLRHIGRPERASPAEGSSDAHGEEQGRIVTAAFAEAQVLEPAD
jgi:2-oxoglutarate dehydrogenase E1 component